MSPLTPAPTASSNASPLATTVNAPAVPFKPTLRTFYTEYPVYKEWVASGGLIFFADQHGLKHYFNHDVNSFPGCITSRLYVYSTSFCPGLRAQMEAVVKYYRWGPFCDRCHQVRECICKDLDLEDLLQSELERELKRELERELKRELESESESDEDWWP
jgi:hypothetical protein